MIHDIGSIKSSSGATMLKMWEVSVPPGNRSLRKHCHICFEISYVNFGSGIYAVENAQYPISAGDMFIFASNEQHCITNVGNAGLEITNLHFEPKYLWGYSEDSLSEENINLCFSHNQKFENRIDSDNATELANLFMQIKSEFTVSDKEYPLSVKSLLNLFLITLIRKFAYAKKNRPLSRDRLNSIRNVIKYIDSHLSEEIRLYKLAEIAGMSPNYFSWLFHHVSGTPLWDYINLRRIDMAIRRLSEEPEKNIIEIALLCGFNNTANFNKIFKKHTGMTPTEYRNSDNILIS